MLQSSSWNETELLFSAQFCQKHKLSRSNRKRMWSRMWLINSESWVWRQRRCCLATPTQTRRLSWTLKPSETTSTLSSSALPKLGWFNPLQKVIFGTSEGPTFIYMLHFGKAKPLCCKGTKSFWMKQKIRSSVNDSTGPTKWHYLDLISSRYRKNTSSDSIVWHFNLINHFSCQTTASQACFVSC